MKAIRFLIPVAIAITILSIGLYVPSTLATPPNTAATVLAVKSTAITADGYSSIIDWSRYTEADFYWTIDQTEVGGVVNTTTVTLETTADRVTWVNSESDATLISANVADVAGATNGRVMVTGRWARLYFNVSNSNPVTIVVKAVLR